MSGLTEMSLSGQMGLISHVTRIGPIEGASTDLVGKPTKSLENSIVDGFADIGTLCPDLGLDVRNTRYIRT